MRWKKLGQVFCPNNNAEWMVSHASNPVAECLNESVHRIYFSCRDKDNRSSIGFVDVDLNSPQTIVNLSSEPILTQGEKGYFDDSGITMGCIVRVKEQTYIYYLGWNLCVTVPWRNSIGVAVKASSDAKYHKHLQNPVLDRNYLDPLTVSYPWVLQDESKWRMWYGSHTSWGERQEDLVHVIKYAESSDGINWERSGRAVLALSGPGEKAMSRPCVLQSKDLYRMWYSYRPGSEYRLGYAESQDGFIWERHDAQVGIGVSSSGWDSESVEYASIFSHDEKLFMLYNGNKYGATGFGLAVLD